MQLVQLHEYKRAAAAELHTIPHDKSHASTGKSIASPHKALPGAERSANIWWDGRITERTSELAILRKTQA